MLIVFRSMDRLCIIITSVGAALCIMILIALDFERKKCCRNRLLSAVTGLKVFNIGIARLLAYCTFIVDLNLI